jgi:hypothetical protein
MICLEALPDGRASDTYSELSSALSVSADGRATNLPGEQSPLS